jgi:dihydroneopterin aldolase
MVFYGHHGVSTAEQELGQRFVVDLEVFKDLSGPGRSDSLDDTVNYADLYKTAKEAVEDSRHNLLESLAESIARRVLDGFEVQSVRVAVKKPEAPIKGSILDYAGVEVVRGSSL